MTVTGRSVGRPDRLEGAVRDRREEREAAARGGLGAVVELVHAGADEEERHQRRERDGGKQPVSQPGAAAKREDDQQNDRQHEREIVETLFDEDLGRVRREEVSQKRHGDTGFTNGQQRPPVGDERGEDGGQRKQGHSDDAENGGPGSEKFLQRRLFFRHAKNSSLPCIR